MRAEMMALVSQGASVDPNRQVPDASSGHRAFRESAEDENPYTPPPEDQVLMPQNHQTASVEHETWHTRPPRHERLVGEDRARIGFPVWELEPDFTLGKLVP
ncbi:hypothetical protein CsSME_00039557 [Camellia sinensis var. sinensis]